MGSSRFRIHNLLYLQQKHPLFLSLLITYSSLVTLLPKKIWPVTSSNVHRILPARQIKRITQMIQKWSSFTILTSTTCTPRNRLICAVRTFSDPKITRLTPHSPVIGPSFEVPLPRWRNRIDIYYDPKTRRDFLSSIHMGQLGLWKNLQRRLGIDLHYPSY